MSDLNAVVIDLEATGLNPKIDKIIEIGAARIRGGKVVETFETFVNPGQSLAETIVNLTGITDEDLKDAPQFKDIAPELLNFLGEDVFLGHSITSDYAYLKKAFVVEMPKGFKFEKLGIDTLKIARLQLPPEIPKKLPMLCEYFGIEYRPHRALSDALATARVYEKLYESFYGKEPTLFAPKLLNYQVKKESPIMQKQINQLNKLLEEKGLTLNRDIEKLTKSEASRLVDRIKSGQAL